MNKRNTKSVDPERHNNYKAEADEIIRRLKTDSKFCQEFFYGTEDVECKIAPMRSSILSDLEQNYNVVMSPMDFSTIVYQTLLSEGTWSTVDTYDAKSTFFVWLKKVAWNAALESIEEESTASLCHPRTAGNTRLVLRSQPVEKCKLIIDDHLMESKYYDLLCSIYVSRLSKEEVMVKYCMTEQELNHAQKEGERELKEALLRSSRWYVEDILHDKTRNIVTVSSDFVSGMEEWINTKTEENPFADVFGINLTDEEVHEKVVEFLYVFSAKLGWNDRDRFLWRQRFIHNASPVKLAKTLDRPRPWVDTRYSQLNKRFVLAVRKWWATHAE